MFILLTKTFDNLFLFSVYHVDGSLPSRMKHSHKQGIPVHFVYLCCVVSLLFTVAFNWRSLP